MLINQAGDCVRRGRPLHLFATPGGLKSLRCGCPLPGRFHALNKGKPGFPGGTKISPTRIEILRPDPPF
ncbi:hypothetical protein F0170_04860 [Pseudomonas sp. MAFF 730085]|uniref:Uncharacterized protein n=1 Tax=Pseudomonas kitaguniensis TaxID=2607908 RepID=A0A5N7JQ00_9PSED|nr:hypothetical protein [Pseudomonas kitaguniensis]